uniref:Molybdate transport system ATP-binding protein n=1 Tax=Candidatus Kentrum eta TaxID=2126337 RepID=A0A450V1R6_9GAMM|nr:MAG: molybdate transport system ATP-binding protein [Candidatus Kentron sp. H]VFJ92131.1 MAG: molybdate transport system ATP-binding protein [Candidatus Kentron sp. H]VFJ98721.1 MAG: molybdate transport system ATP-binding protein [Candidatus Kentron sp. H]
MGKTTAEKRPSSDLTVELQDTRGRFHLEVAFQAPARGVTALFGRSGSGKTSILRAIAGLAKAQRAVVRLGEDIWQDSERCLPTHKRPIGYVFQTPDLFGHLSVRGNLEYGWRRVPARQRRVDFDDAVQWLELAPLLARATDTLSGGERQRVAIARALLTSPRLLLMDEPLSALDHEAKQGILRYLEGLRDRLAIPALYVTHDPNEAARLAHGMILLEGGRILAQGPAADLLTRLNLPLATYDDAAAILEGRVSRHDPAYHLTWIALRGGLVAIPRQDLPVGKRSRVRVMARDVSLSLRVHSDTSILNILPAKVVDTRAVTPSQIIVRLELSDGQHMLSRITRRSAMSLGLGEGMPLYAQVKSVALIE